MRQASVGRLPSRGTDHSSPQDCASFGRDGASWGAPVRSDSFRSRHRRSTRLFACLRSSREGRVDQSKVASRFALPFAAVEERSQKGTMKEGRPFPDENRPISNMSIILLANVFFGVVYNIRKIPGVTCSKNIGSRAYFNQWTTSIP